MDTIMLELRNTNDWRTGQLGGAWIEMRQGGTQRCRTGVHVFAGRPLETPGQSGR
jgi:hypothetical protein